ncbi:hypothetical protein VFPPC_01894 [Pochonia chlamydosporia 170]|uniref:Uncharacterized protein n=1 Tax=Pochonia chlamydosporia 170 TaxID=1380566 RepID=A0A179G988_METCM|nr:hypothetical protein VFPPC_01894 [Pochonia chlamydosporia 170]OAQ74372.1 hypothetical protein VFPPC_01894 [Pochonia chlamydosporia 170]
MDSFGLRAKFLQDGLLDNVDFVNSITEESIEDTHWTLCRSYTVRSHVIEEEFDIQLSDGDKTPHVECALKVTIRSKDAPQDDTREKIFKPRRWFGPDLEVEVVDQHISPGRLSAETSPGSSSLSSVSLRQELIGRRATPSTISESQLPLQADLPNRPTSVTKYNTIEYCTLITAKAVAEGSRILVNEPQKEQDELMASIRNCFKEEMSSDSLMAKWKQWKEEGIPFSELFGLTNSYSEELLLSAVSIENVGRYMTGITQHYNFSSQNEEPPAIPSKKNDQPYYRDGQIVHGILKLTSELSNYYGTSAIALFTILEVGNASLAYLSGSAPGNDFFNEAVVALIDLSWRRLANEQEATYLCTLPVVNPPAFHSWYTGHNYQETCMNMNLKSFANNQERSHFELPATEILRAIRERSKNIVRSSADHGVNTDTSKQFILHNAPRLAKYITNEERQSRTKQYTEGEQKNVDLALSILEGTASSENLLTTPIEVVFIIVDILLDRNPKARRKRTKTAKRKCASKKSRLLENGADKDLHTGTSRTQQGIQQTSWLRHSVHQSNSLQTSSRATEDGSNTFESEFNTMFPQEPCSTASASLSAADRCTTGYRCTTGLVPGGNVMTDGSLPSDDFGDSAGGNIGFEPRDDRGLFAGFNDSEADTGLPDMNWEEWGNFWALNDSDINTGLPPIYWQHITTS